MMTKILFLSSVLLTAAANAECIEKVIYGSDNRVDVYKSPNELYKKLSTSTAAMISTSSLQAQENGYLVKSSTLEGDGVCSDAPFAKQKTAAMCSGFLIGKDLLITAGHCIRTKSDCESYSWVFDYSNTSGERSDFIINKKDIYKCSKIISRELDEYTKDDFALIKLDRATDREPLNFRKSGKISDCSEIVVIGHPSGLPTKIADDAYVRLNSNKYYFEANLDTFGGNSGSAVFDAKSGLVEGILVRGENDYVLDSLSNCNRSRVCKMKECRGEDVTRITNIKALKNL